MAITPIYTKGVKYIKIAKTDVSGSDNTIYLQNLDNIRIKFSDLTSPTDYPAISVTEYPNYYLYTINAVDITSSADQQILKYDVSASSTTLNYFSGSLQSYSVLTDSLSYFTASSGYWTLGNTPNISLNVTCSVTFSVVAGSSLGSFPGASIIGPIFSLYRVSNGVTSVVTSASVGGVSLNPSSSATTVGPYSLAISCSLTPVENDIYYLQMTPTPAALDSFTRGWYYYNVANSRFLVTQSFATQSSTNDLIVLEPYIDGTFQNSDCNVLQNNVDINQINGFYMTVDYTSGSILPQNQAEILNGSATRAQVQSWNYTYNSHIRGRYVGKQQNALAINTYSSASSYPTTPFGFSGSWPGDTISPKVNGSILIQQLDSCIYEINWGAGGYPENSYGGGFNMGNIYLVGSNPNDVTAITPNSDLYYDILEKNIPNISTILTKQFTPNNNLPNNLISLYPAVTIENAHYWIPSNFNTPGTSPLGVTGTVYPTGGALFPIGTPGLVLARGSGQTIPIGTSGGTYQQTGSSIPIDTAINEITSSLNSGERWFASIYYGVGSFASTSSIPGLKAVADLSNNYQVGYPFEIANIKATSSGIFPLYAVTLKTGSANPVGQYFNALGYGSGLIGGSGGFYNYGLILTKAGYKTNSLTVLAPSGSWRNISGAGPGYVILPYATNVVEQNATDITKKFGNNPNP